MSQDTDACLIKLLKTSFSSLRMMWRIKKICVAEVKVLRGQSNAIRNLQLGEGERKRLKTLGKYLCRVCNCCRFVFYYRNMAG